MEEELAFEIEEIGAGRLSDGKISVRAQLDLQGESRREGALRAVGAVDVGARPWRGLFWHQRAKIDSDGEGDPDFLGREWRDGVSAHFQLAYFALTFDRARVYAGRREVEWGVGLEGGMILGGQKPSFDLLGGEIDWGIFTGEAFVAPLDDISFSGDQGELSSARRYIAAHRIAFPVGKRFRIGLSETIVYGGENRPFDWKYANPLLLYYAEQWIHDRDDNPFWCIDAYFRAGESIDLFGEFLVDDFQYDFKTEPNQIGFLAGARIKNIPGMGGLFLDGEYLRINNWVYGHGVPWNRYTYGTANLGHPIGPDADRTLFRFTQRWGSVWEGEGQFRYERHGEGRIDDPRDSAVPFGNTFLTGETALRRGFGIALGCHPDAAQRYRIGADLLEGDWTVSASAMLRFRAEWNRP